MSWNYRIMRRSFVHKNGEKEEWLGIHEVYYSSDKKVEGYTENSVSPGGMDEDELKTTLGLMMKAFDLPILEYEESSRQDNPENDL